MNAVRRIIDSSRWLDASATVDELPCFSLFLDGGRIGDARLALSVWDANSVRTCYLGSIETAHGTLSVLCELPLQSEEATRITRENAVAAMALDSGVYVFDNGWSASQDLETGYWCVVHVGANDAVTVATREEAIALAHAGGRV